MDYGKKLIIAFLVGILFLAVKFDRGLRLVLAEPKSSNDAIEFNLKEIIKNKKERKGAKSTEENSKYAPFTYKKYSNDKLNYSLEYPSFLIEEKSCENQQVFTAFNKEKTVKLTTFIENKEEDKTLKSIYDEEIKKQGNLYYKHLDSDYYFISWNSEEKIYYKSLKSGKNFNYGYILEAPKGEREIFDSIATKIFNSFKIK